MQSGGLMTSGHSGETSTGGELFTNLFGISVFPLTTLPMQRHSGLHPP